jgi:hypothetical protein
MRPSRARLDEGLGHRDRLGLALCDRTDAITRTAPYEHFTTSGTGSDVFASFSATAPRLCVRLVYAVYTAWA